MGSEAVSLPKPEYNHGNPLESTTAQDTPQTALQSRKRALLQLLRRESLYPAELSGQIAQSLGRTWASSSSDLLNELGNGPREVVRRDDEAGIEVKTVGVCSIEAYGRVKMKLIAAESPTLLAQRRRSSCPLRMSQEPVPLRSLDPVNPLNKGLLVAEIRAKGFHGLKGQTGLRWKKLTNHRRILTEHMRVRWLWSVCVGLITGRLRRRAGGHFAGLTLLRESDANSFGVESAGVWQVRGNGSLGLTRHELLFAQWVPNRLLRIPRASIVEVASTRSHLGKTIRRDLLKVVWSTDIGTQDSIALWVGDLDGWVGALRP